MLRDKMLRARVFRGRVLQGRGLRGKGFGDKMLRGTEVDTKSPEQALTLLSEDSPNFVSESLFETLARSLGVQNF